MQGLKASTLRPLMSALGHKQTCAAHKPMSAKCQIADIAVSLDHLVGS